MRIPSLGGRALEKAGGATVTVAAGEIYTNLERGVIDAVEWVGPYHDYKLGLNKVAKYYCSPAWHEPSVELEVFANKEAYDKLPKEYQEMLLTASLRVQAWSLPEFDAQNGYYLEKILSEGAVLKEFPEQVLKTLKKYSEDALNELIEKDAMAKKAYKSYNAFRKKANKWTEVSEKSFINNIQLII